VTNIPGLGRVQVTATAVDADNVDLQLQVSPVSPGDSAPTVNGGSPERVSGSLFETFQSHLPKQANTSVIDSTAATLNDT
jgi:hypothetical protein